MARPRAPRQAGFTLVEAMVALMVFTVGALGLLTMTYSSHQGVTTAEDVTNATALARSKLDELVRLAYNDTNLDAGGHDDGTTNMDETGTPTAGVFGADDGNFARSWDVAIPDANEQFKTIAVRVRWWDKNYNTERDVVLRGGRGQ